LRVVVGRVRVAVGIIRIRRRVGTIIRIIRVVRIRIRENEHIAATIEVMKLLSTPETATVEVTVAEIPSTAMLTSDESSISAPRKGHVRGAIVNCTDVGSSSNAGSPVRSRWPAK
jgi:hypothetical protein